MLPLCRDHVWQARAVAGPVLAPALAAIVLREAEQRLAFAADAAAAYRGSRRLLDRLGARVRRRLGRGAPLWHRCAAAASARSACVPARPASAALSLVAALVESADGRRAFESGYGLCVRHAAQAMAMPDAPALRRHRRADDPGPAGAAALGAGGTASARRLAGPAGSGAASNRRPGSGPVRVSPAPFSADRLTATASARIFCDDIVGMEFPVTALMG